MNNYLKTLSAKQLEDLIKSKIDGYLNEEYDYTVRELNNSKGAKISFKIDIRDKDLEKSPA